MRINVRRWGAFNLVGFAGYVLQLSAITLLTRGAGWQPLPATAVALELAALQNFLAHSRWTWGDRRESSLRAWLRRYWRYQVAKTASLAANLALTSALCHAGLPPEAANTIAVLLCSIPNYLVSEHLIFERSTPRSGSAGL